MAFWCSTPSLLSVVNLAEPQHCTTLTPEFSVLPWNISSYHTDLSYASFTKFFLVACLFWHPKLAEICWQSPSAVSPFSVFGREHTWGCKGRVI